MAAEEEEDFFFEEDEGAEVSSISISSSCLTFVPDPVNGFSVRSRPFLSERVNSARAGVAAACSALEILRGVLEEGNEEDEEEEEDDDDAAAGSDLSDDGFLSYLALSASNVLNLLIHAF